LQAREDFCGHSFGEQVGLLQNQLAADRDSCSRGFDKGAGNCTDSGHYIFVAKARHKPVTLSMMKRVARFMGY